MKHQGQGEIGLVQRKMEFTAGHVASETAPSQFAAIG
jgi:hypothetical protein